MGCFPQPDTQLALKGGTTCALFVSLGAPPVLVPPGANQAPVGERPAPRPITPLEKCHESPNLGAIYSPKGANP